MNPEDAQELQAHIQGIAKILYKNTPSADARQSRNYRKVCTAANARTR